MSETTLFVADRVHTMDQTGPDADAVLVAGGGVLAVGRASDLRGTASQVVDFSGATITAGLVDGHSHPISGATMTAGVDLTQAEDLPAVKAALLAGRDRLADGAWLLGWGLLPTVFGDIEPSAAALGAVAEGVPMAVTMFDGHSVVASTKALRLAGIDGAREFASNARIVVAADGEPTGWLLEAEAFGLVSAVIPEPGLDELADRLQAILAEMASVGYTGLHVMDFRNPAAELLALLEERGDLPLRLGCNPMLLPGEDLESVLALQGMRGRRWLIEGVKFMVDGTIDGGTAWLEYPDTHGESLDSLWRDFDAFTAAVTALHRAGVNCSVHAIGDRGVRQVLELLIELRRSEGPLARHRIEHIETIPDEVVELFATDAAAASMQPLHNTAFVFADRSDNWSVRLGDVRVDNGFRWRDLRAAGAVLALGSDWPVAPHDPRWIMADAQLRRRYDRPGSEAPQPWQTLTALQALEGFTTQAALASGEADHRGQIAPGYDADFTVFAEDPLSLDPEALGQVVVTATVVAGEVVGG